MVILYIDRAFLLKVTAIPKEAAEDTSIVVGNMNGESITVPIPKGADITISAPGLHYNRMVSVDNKRASLLTRNISQLAIGMTPTCSNLNVFSKIGLGMLSCPLAAVTVLFLYH